MPNTHYYAVPEAAEMFSEDAERPGPDPLVSPEPEIPLPDVTDEELALACRARLGLSAADRQEAEDIRLRALADMDNARKRLAREKEEFQRYAGESVLADILPALDTLDLALSHAPRDEACRNFVIGVDMTRKILLEALERHGLTEVGQLGEPFDPANHEAIGAEKHPDYAPDTVCALMSKGYRLKDRLLRPAKVVVCKP
jgi:molecular chaperone GrpE